MDDNKVAVLLENLMPQFRTFGENIDGLRDDFKEKIADFRIETNMNFQENKQGLNTKI